MNNENETSKFIVANHSGYYDSSSENYERYWANEANKLEWITPFNIVKNTSFDPMNISIKWFEDGVLNASQNCLDRHLYKKGDKTAIIWESDDGLKSKKLTYRDLFNEVCRFAGVLKSLNVKKGDTVAIYMPMTPEIVIAMLACSRIGAIHCVIFGGFSPRSLAERIADVGASIIITADEGMRAGKIIPLKKQVDYALVICEEKHNHIVSDVVVLENTGGDITLNHRRDQWWDVLMDNAIPVIKPEPMCAEDPLFVLYTSGSTGKPKGILHTTGGYLVQAATTLQLLFQKHEDEVFWCTADVGWITGHTYLVYAPLCNGLTTVMHEGVPSWPTADRLATIVDKHAVSILYTAPTVIRSLMSEEEASLGSTHRKSLHTLGSVGEPINPEAWIWYREKFGNGTCSIVDTWWQTETGGIMIAPQSDNGIHKPGAALTPCPGVSIAVLDDAGRHLSFGERGNLVILDSWPGQARTIWGDHKRFSDSYFNVIPGVYFTGDGAYRDVDGDFWITGRVDDVLNISGHRLSTAEIEAAIASHPKVSEAAIVGVPHPIKGEYVYAYVSIKDGESITQTLSSELRARVRDRIGPVATPEVIQWSNSLPKTRSGKILRRVLKKIASGDIEALGDLSTLSNPEVISVLLNSHL